MAGLQCEETSYHCLQIGAHHLFHSADSGVFEQSRSMYCFLPFLLPRILRSSRPGFLRFKCSNPRGHCHKYAAPSLRVSCASDFFSSP